MPTREFYDVRAAEVLKRLNGGPVMGAEVGVFCGDMSRELLIKRDDMTLVMVDAWAESPLGSTYRQSEDPHSWMTQAEIDDCEREARRQVAFAGERAVVIHADSMVAAAMMRVGTLDFVFLDAEHSYAAVKQDIEVWSQMVKPGGWIGGHDYDNEWLRKFGVKAAVNEFAVNKRLDLGADTTWFVRL